MSSKVLVALRIKAAPLRVFEVFTADIGAWWKPNALFSFTPRSPGVLAFEGMDAAGKGGTIKRFTEHLKPSRCTGGGAGETVRAGSWAVVLPAVRGPTAHGRGDRAVRPSSYHRAVVEKAGDGSSSQHIEGRLAASAADERSLDCP